MDFLTRLTHVTNIYNRQLQVQVYCCILPHIARACLVSYRQRPTISKLDPPTPSITEQAAIIQKAIAKIVKL